MYNYWLNSKIASWIIIIIGIRKQRVKEVDDEGTADMHQENSSGGRRILWGVGEGGRGLANIWKASDISRIIKVSFFKSL